MSKKESFLSKLWGVIKKWLLSPALQNKVVQFLKDKLIKAALLKFLGSAAAGGIKAWIIKFVVTELVEASDEYVIEPLFRKLGYYLDRQEGKNVYKQLEDSSTDDDWIDAANRV